jgi:hypothetical protein
MEGWNEGRNVKEGRKGGRKEGREMKDEWYLEGKEGRKECKERKGGEGRKVPPP